MLFALLIREQYGKDERKDPRDQKDRSQGIDWRWENDEPINLNLIDINKVRLTNDV